MRLAALLAAAGAVFASDHGFGPLPPAPLPDIEVTTDAGRTVSLRKLVEGRPVAVQFVFTSCATACPLLGGLFASVEKRLEAAPAVPYALLSVSVDPRRDVPERLGEWIGQFRKGRSWTAVRVNERELIALLAAFGEKPGPLTGHSTQVFYVNSAGEAIGRTVALPDPGGVAAAIRALAPDTATGARLFRDQPPAGRLAASTEDLPSAALRCANCHGPSGEGRAEGETAPSRIDARSLREAKLRRGGPPSQYGERSFCDALRTGQDPAGVVLHRAMPRYAVSDEECRHLWAFTALLNGVPTQTAEARR